MVIYTPAIKTLGILDYFNQNQFEVLKRAKVLGLITENTDCIAIAGTHGKTTTSTLVAHLCKEADLPFSCFWEEFLKTLNPTSCTTVLPIL